ncbi:MAG: hypothetical protein V7L05_17355 [Nostoc sp.]|uniref:hypothetical protein n=1 Tax=Nostoc sp. TaxID=1180 RepID=UPI002FF44A74
MGHGEEVTNALCPMPQATGRLSLSTHEGMEFPVAFNESGKTGVNLSIYTVIM